MHNGNVHDFTKIRRALLERLRDCLFEWLSGAAKRRRVLTPGDAVR